MLSNGWLMLILYLFSNESWVNEKTHGKIPEIVAYFQPETKVVLASALYFKAMWEKTFLDGATGP